MEGVFDYQETSSSNEQCPKCAELTLSHNMDKVVKLTAVPSVLVLALNGEPHMISPHIKIPFNGKMFKLKLRGVIYGGQFHFTSRIISPDGSIWYHDGMTTQSSCSRQGSIHHLSSMNYLRACVEGDAQKTAVSLIYARK